MNPLVSRNRRRNPRFAGERAELASLVPANEKIQGQIDEAEQERRQRDPGEQETFGIGGIVGGSYGCAEDAEDGKGECQDGNDQQERAEFAAGPFEGRLGGRSAGGGNRRVIRFHGCCCFPYVALGSFPWWISIQPTPRGNRNQGNAVVCSVNGRNPKLLDSRGHWFGCGTVNGIRRYGCGMVLSPALSVVPLIS